MSSTKIVFTSNNVLLAGSNSCKPATIIADRVTGKIVEVKETRSTRADFTDVTDDSWVDAGEKWILPGLVEYV